MTYLGVRAGDLDGQPYARFWSPRMAPLSDDARDAIARGPLPAPLLPAFADPFDGTTETGYGVSASAAHVAVRTPMPGVTPAMIAWWFAWHSDEPCRYKLWHPRAHVHARWREPGHGYLGRTSLVDEYLGDRLGRFAIHFVAPAELGLPADGADAVTICARVGLADVPVDAGWLAHRVERTGDGAVMRSRFWLGGAHVAARSAILAPAVPLARPFARLGVDPAALLVHCAEEMAHLASFLPALFAVINPAT